VAAQETRLDPSVLERAVAKRKVLDLRALGATDLVEPYLFIDDVPEGAVVLDCRPAHQYRAWKHRAVEVGERRSVDATAGPACVRPEWATQCRVSACSLGRVSGLLNGSR
jgi:hypothetical protein